MRVLVACEYSATVRDAFLARGHFALSCDLLPTDSDVGPHYRGNVLDILGGVGGKPWDLMIAHPPCTYIAASGMHWNAKVEGRTELMEQALQFVCELLNAPIPLIALENPVGCISTRIRKPSQYVQPYQFGHTEAKKTGLWLQGLPLLQPTKLMELPECGSWDNQSYGGQDNRAPGPDRWKIRSTTYTGIAAAMAAQWGGYPLQA